MAHYDLYASLGLDRTKQSAELAQELDRRLTGLRSAGVGEKDARIQESKTARAILGDDSRRRIYDARLDDPKSRDITVPELFALAHYGAFPPAQLGGAGRPAGHHLGQSAAHQPEARPGAESPYGVDGQRPSSPADMRRKAMPATAKVLVGIGLFHTLFSMVGALLSAMSVRAFIGSASGLLPGLGINLPGLLGVGAAPTILALVSLCVLQGVWGVYLMARTLRPFGRMSRAVIAMVGAVYIVADLCLFISGVSGLSLLVLPLFVLHVVAVILLSVPGTGKWFAQAR